MDISRACLRKHSEKIIFLNKYCKRKSQKMFYDQSVDQSNTRVSQDSYISSHYSNTYI